MLGHRAEDAQAQVGQRADGERDRLARQPGDQRRVLDRTHAVIDARRAEQVERLDHVGRRPLLAGVGDHRLAEFAAARENPRELARRMPLLRRIEAEAMNPVKPGLGLGQRGERLFLAEMAQEAEDQQAADAPALAPDAQALLEAVEHRPVGDAARRVGLRIEEDLGMDDVIRRRPLEVSEHQVAEIVGGAQHVGAGVVEVEEGLQAVEIVGRPQRRLVGIRQRDAVAAGQRKGQIRLERALDMHMQLGLGHAAGKIENGVVGGHRRNSP